MSSSSSLINCKVVPGGDGLVELVAFVRFESFLATVFLFGIPVLLWQGLSLSKWITCASSCSWYPGCGIHCLKLS